MQPRSEINIDRYREALRITGLDTLRFEGNKSFGEHGKRLSGGQVQRIGIARALYKNSEVMVFDESTNALDEFAEERLLETIFNECSDKTMFIVSHRQKLLSRCNLILTIEEGNLRVEHMGRPHE